MTSETEKWIKQMEKKHRPILANALGEQLIELLNEAGIVGLGVDEEGSVHGSTNRLHVYPTTTYLKNIRLVIDDGKIIIKAEVSSVHENIGSVI